jgi:hypothetical protein
MIRYGVLPEDYSPETDGFDPYAIDQKYYELIYQQEPGPVQWPVTGQFQPAQTAH